MSKPWEDDLQKIMKVIGKLTNRVNNLSIDLEKCAETIEEGAKTTKESASTILALAEQMAANRELIEKIIKML